MWSHNYWVHQPFLLMVIKKQFVTKAETFESHEPSAIHSNTIILYTCIQIITTFYIALYSSVSHQLFIVNATVGMNGKRGDLLSSLHIILLFIYFESFCLFSCIHSEIQNILCIVKEARCKIISLIMIYINLQALFPRYISLHCTNAFLLKRDVDPQSKLCLILAYLMTFQAIPLKWI